MKAPQRSPPSEPANSPLPSAKTCSCSKQSTTPTTQPVNAPHNSAKHSASPQAGWAHCSSSGSGSVGFHPWPFSSGHASRWGFDGALATATDIGSGILFLAWGVLLAKAFLLDRLMVNRIAGKVHKQLRMVNRPMSGYLGSIQKLPRTYLQSNDLPTTDSDEQRYAMFARLKRVIEAYGFSGILVVIDRVDEPTLVNGDPDRMRSIIWPMFNNKFLQLDRVGIKMLLPIELRHALFKESSAFFQEARLDKQNMIERLSWTGASLYDLCNARLGVCRPASSEPISLIDLFKEDVTRNDVVDALGAMQQPRDALQVHVPLPERTLLKCHR